MSSRPASAVIVRLSKQQQKTNKQSNKQQTKKPYPVCQLENGFEKNRRARKDLTCKPGEDRTGQRRTALGDLGRS